MTSLPRRRPRLSQRLAAALAIAVLTAAPLAADIAIVTGGSTAVDALDEEQARQLWLGTLERVGGTKLRIADRSDEPIRAEFYRRVLGKTRGQVKAIRAKRAFQRGIAPPPELPGDASVLEWVLARENRLGYVDAAAVDESVKVLLIIKVPIEVPPRSEQP